MKKLISKQKLSLNKEVLQSLTAQHLKMIQGGGIKNNNIVTNGCQTEGKNEGC